MHLSFSPSVCGYTIENHMSNRYIYLWKVLSCVYNLIMLYKYPQIDCTGRGGLFNVVQCME